MLDGELVVPYEGRLHFGELQRRARRRCRGAVQAAAERPAYLIVFGVLEAGGTELLARPYRDRRAILETSSPATCSPPRSKRTRSNPVHNPEPSAPRPPDLVDGDFTASR